MKSNIFGNILLFTTVLFVGGTIIPPSYGQIHKTDYIDTHVHLDGLYPSKGKIAKFLSPFFA